MNFLSKLAITGALAVAALSAQATTYKFVPTGANSYFAVGSAWTTRSDWTYDNLLLDANGSTASLTGYSMSGGQRYNFNFQFTSGVTTNGITNYANPNVGYLAGSITDQSGISNQYYIRGMVANFGVNSTPYNSYTGLEFGVWLQNLAGKNAGDFNVGVVQCTPVGAPVVAGRPSCAAGGTGVPPTVPGVPLPGSLLLLGIGLVALGLRKFK
jgi:hypothetical protein